MAILLAGLVLFAAVHWFPAALPDTRRALVASIGEIPYKGLFAVLSLVAFGLIVKGWQDAPLVKIYVPPFFGNWLIGGGIGIAIVLFFAPYVPSNLRRLLRHPQLLGVILWGVAHLFVNGTARDLLLFGGFSVWALVAMLLANRRDGEWERPPAQPLWGDVLLLAVGLLATAALFSFHSRLFGVTPIYLA
jgi:uncharacterized membrane protein